MNAVPVDYESLQQALGNLAAMSDASEAHGTLCGLLLGQQDFTRWLDFTLDVEPDQSNLTHKEALKVLQEFYRQTQADLNAEDMSLDLMLPDEGIEFAQRLIALAGWCQGFLYGLGVCGESLLKGLSDQGRECLDDLLQISQLSHEEEPSEASENVYAEIVEHVRLSVIYINEEINPVMPAPQIQ